MPSLAYTLPPPPPLPLAQIRVTISYTNLEAQTGAHIHLGPIGGVGPVAVFLPVGPIAGLVLPVSANTVAQLLAGNMYINVHTAQNPGGDIRGQIAFPGLAGTAYLSALQQVAQVTSSATGVGMVSILSPTAVNVSLWLTGVMDETAAHLHVGGGCGGVCGSCWCACCVCGCVRVHAWVRVCACVLLCPSRGPYPLPPCTHTNPWTSLGEG
jgi:hypothetical protein